jgi:hypothetical protein
VSAAQQADGLGTKHKTLFNMWVIEKQYETLCCAREIGRKLKDFNKAKYGTGMLESIIVL